MVSNIRSKFHIFFHRDRLGSLAKQTSMIERQRKLSAGMLLKELAFWNSDTIGYQDMATSISANHGVNVSAQAIAKKMQKADLFFAAAAREAVSASSVPQAPEACGIHGVDKILLADSSIIRLRKSLAATLPGTGGDGPDAAVKLHAVFNLTNQSVEHLAIDKGTTSEHSYKGCHRELTGMRNLIIRDLGFFDVKDLELIEDDGGYYLSRIPLNVKNFRDSHGAPFDLWKHLSKSRSFAYEDVLFVADKEAATRVVAIRLPRWKWKERIESSRKSKKRALTKKEMAQAKWNLMITNLSTDQATADKLAKLYAMRWQIELLFKAWKASIGIDHIKMASCQRVVMAFIWARLAFAIVLADVRKLVQEHTGEEIGLIRWYRRVAGQGARLRALAAADKWLALARYFCDKIVPAAKPEKTSRRTSARKLNDC